MNQIVIGKMNKIKNNNFKIKKLNISLYKKYVKVCLKGQKKCINIFLP